MSTVRPLSWWLLVVACVSFPLALLARDPKPSVKFSGSQPPAMADDQNGDDSDDTDESQDRAKRFATKIDTPLIGDSPTSRVSNRWCWKVSDWWSG